MKLIIVGPVAPSVLEAKASIGRSPLLRPGGLGALGGVCVSVEPTWRESSQSKWSELLFLLLACPLHRRIATKICWRISIKHLVPIREKCNRA